MRSVMAIDSLMAGRRITDVYASNTDMGISMRTLLDRNTNALVRFPLLRDLASIVADDSIPSCVRADAIRDTADRMMVMVVRDMPTAVSLHGCAYSCAGYGCTHPSGLYTAMSDLATLADLCL